MKIIQFEEKYKDEVIDMILDIQIDEFNINITRNDQPDLEDIVLFYQVGSGNFWIALTADDKVIGSIGLVDIGHNSLAMRKMFVHKNYRGNSYKIAQHLLDNAISWSRQHLSNRIILGTTSSYHAAHRFYEKNRFIEISKNDLPENFPVMAVDTKFYYLDL